MENNFLELLKDTLEIEDRDLTVNDEFRTYPEWDSLALLSVIAMIDDEFDVIIEGNDFAKINTVGELIEAIKLAKD
jgi:acyl carrier protein